MEVLDYSLIGWGIDILYMILNGLDKKESYAIIHYIKCINPEDNHKLHKKRELSCLKNCDLRKYVWIIFAKKKKIPQGFHTKEFKSIKISDVSDLELELK